MMYYIKKTCVLLIAGVIFISQLIHANHSLTLTKRQLCDLEMIMSTAFAPLKGFMNQTDYQGVVDYMRLADGTLWPMPIVLDVDQEVVKKLKSDRTLNLKSPEGDLLATMQVTDIWEPNRLYEAEKVYGTTNPEHPGVEYILKQTKPFYVGGTVTKIAMPKHYDFTDLRKTPAELKAYFKEHNITKIVAFQTRNPMHRAHVELTRRASQQTDAHLLIQPVVGLTKPGDVDHFTRVRCYKKLLKYYPTGSVTLAVIPLSMRMAGPREALWHAIIRKNHGCTHFIVGRDHAGPGKDSNGILFYEPYDAQELVKQYAQEIGIEVVPFNEMLYIPEIDSYLPSDQVPAGTKTMSISGTELRAMLRKGSEIPTWFTYPEVVQELRITFPPRHKQGFTVFFTGLSGAGKSTLANALALKLMEIQDRPISLLDGDQIRTYLSSELGFSKEHRSLNVRRVGFVASEITKNGGIALCALIAPYEQDRQHNRTLIGNNGGYLEIFVATPLDACEQRDVKGLYAKARAGQIQAFTGISDPYEQPQHPELTIDTTKISVDQALDIIVNHLKKEGFIV